MECLILPRGHLRQALHHRGCPGQVVLQHGEVGQPVVRRCELGILFDRGFKGRIRGKGSVSQRIKRPLETMGQSRPRIATQDTFCSLAGLLERAFFSPGIGFFCPFQNKVFGLCKGLVNL